MVIVLFWGPKTFLVHFPTRDTYLGCGFDLVGHIQEATD